MSSNLGQKRLFRYVDLEGAKAAANVAEMQLQTLAVRYNARCACLTLQCVHSPMLICEKEQHLRCCP